MHSEKYIQWGRLEVELGYLWNVGQMADALAEKRVHRQSQLLAFICWIVVISPAFLFIRPDTTPLESIPLGYLQPLIGIAIVLVGACLCYRANTRGDGEDFVYRTICLGLPLGMVLIILLLIPGNLVLAVVERECGYSLGLYFQRIIQIFFLWRLQYWIGSVAHRAMEHETTIVTTESAE